jgi:hypothetical protein
MLTCLAAFVVGASLMADPVVLADEVRADAAALAQVEEPNAAFFAELDAFVADAETLSQALRAAGVSDDLPCIFHGISEEARVRAAEIAAAPNEEAEDRAMAGLRVLLADAVLLAPIARDELSAR